MKTLRRVISEKEKLSIAIKKLANQSKSLTDLTERLIQQNIQPYFRNHILTGIIFGKRKIRLTTLGIDKDKLKELKREEQRIAELRKSKYTRNIEIKK